MPPNEGSTWRPCLCTSGIAMIQMFVYETSNALKLARLGALSAISIRGHLGNLRLQLAIQHQSQDIGHRPQRSQQALTNLLPLASVVDSRHDNLVAPSLLFSLTTTSPQLEPPTVMALFLATREKPSPIMLICKSRPFSGEKRQ